MSRADYSIDGNVKNQHASEKTMRNVVYCLQHKIKLNKPVYFASDARETLLIFH